MTAQAGQAGHAGTPEPLTHKMCVRERYAAALDLHESATSLRGIRSQLFRTSSCFESRRKDMRASCTPTRSQVVMAMSAILLLTIAASSPCSAFVPASHIQRPTVIGSVPISSPSTSTQLSLNIWGENIGATTSLIATTVGPIASSLFAYGGNVPLWQSCALNAVLFGALRSKLNKMLTAEGFAHAFALGTLLWTTLGWRGWTLCVMYLFLGQAVTKVKFQEKEKAGIAEGRGGRRGPENVWGSALTGLICAACSVQGSGSFLGISSDVYLLAYVASLATKLADTFASEIGKAYGKTTFLITTFERVKPGTEGAVSAEGTAAAVVGGLLLSLCGYAINLISWPGVIVSTIAAFLATNAESLIGATLQEKEGFEFMTNEVVNFINTLIGAFIAILGGVLVLGM